jgi:hypothetical protein
VQDLGSGVPGRTAAGDVYMQVQVIAWVSGSQIAKSCVCPLTAVGCEDAVIDEGGEGQEIEKVGKVHPDVGSSVYPQTLVVKPIHLVGELHGKGLVFSRGWLEVNKGIVSLVDLSCEGVHKT